MAVIYHPETQATVEVPDDAVWHHRQSGWVTVEEWAETQQQAAQQQAAEQAKAPPAPPAHLAARPAKTAADKETK